jgi:hypothetical protein
MQKNKYKKVFFIAFLVRSNKYLLQAMLGGCECLLWCFLLLFKTTTVCKGTQPQSPKMVRQTKNHTPPTPPHHTLLLTKYCIPLIIFFIFSLTSLQQARW